MYKFSGAGYFRSLAVAASMVLFVSGAYGQKSFDVSRQFDVLHSLYRELDEYYVDSLSPEKILNNAINGMMASFDPYTNYIPESETGDLKFLTTGEYGGVGAMIRPYKDKVVVTETYENTPAQKAGILAGDELLEINNVKMSGGNSQRASELLKGQPGTEVKVVVKREGVSHPITKKIIRQLVLINQVGYYGLVGPKTGYINLSGFTDKASQEVRHAFLELKNQGAQKLIFDLRGNGGGLLNEAVAICNLFVPKGQEIVSTRGKQHQWDQTYKTTRDPVDSLIPIVVLVNSGSASSSEIVCGSLQDLDRALILGTRTFGKGLVQTTRSIPYNGLLKVTTAKYYIPSGRCIQAIDYANRNKDGSVGRIPDSLMHEFSTKAGRIVRDGGGIQPDIICEDNRGTAISYYLMEGNYFFDYANNYFRQHEKIVPVKDFKVTDAEYADFLKFVKQRGFTYEKESQKLIGQLKKTLEQENSTEATHNELAALETKLASNVDSDFVKYRDEIELLLSSEIVSRYYFQSGEIQESLKFDPCLKEAIKVINDDDLYRKTLAAKTESKN